MLFPTAPNFLVSNVLNLRRTLNIYIYVAVSYLSFFSSSQETSVETHYWVQSITKRLQQYHSNVIAKAQILLFSQTLLQE